LVAYGVSYGTLYSAMYLERYGDHVKTLVIDGVFDHSIQFPMNLAIDVAATQDAFNRFSGWCSQEATCAIHGKDVEDVFDDDIAAVPVLRFSVPVAFAAGQKGWCEIAETLKKRGPVPVIDPSVLGGATGLFLGVTCGDEGPQSDYTALLSAYAPIFQNSPLFAWKFWDATPYLHLGAGVGDCIGWPYAAGNPPHVLKVGPHPNVLVASTLHDSATSIAYALAVWKQIPQARLLTADTDGHQSMFNSQCAFEKIRSFLIDNKTLPEKTMCPPNEPTVCLPK
jgi:pimeloyl-ACP methyl ester carboxylesterase